MSDGKKENQESGRTKITMTTTSITSLNAAVIGLGIATEIGQSEENSSTSVSLHAEENQRQKQEQQQQVLQQPQQEQQEQQQERQKHVEEDSDEIRLKKEAVMSDPNAFWAAWGERQRTCLQREHQNAKSRESRCTCFEGIGSVM